MTYDDADTVNENYLEAAKEDFDAAMESGKIFAATAVIERLANNGFEREARQLADELLEYKTGV